MAEYAWYGEEWNKGTTHPVKSKKPNGYGLYDRHGNVWEWCADWYGADYYRVSPRNNPTGPSTGQYRVVRGGSWGNSPDFCRSAGRSWFSPDDWYDSFGFRCVSPAR